MGAYKKVVTVRKLGLLPYLIGCQVQHQYARSHLDYLAKKTQSKGENTLLVLEHPPVYTVGTRNKTYTAEDERTLQSHGAEFHRTNRGGLITFHGPGQLVCYPILNLKDFKMGMRQYICGLEKAIIDTCAKFQLTAQTTDDTGVWIGDKKICALGVHASRFVTSHGLALNCNVDLRWFDHIVPCGIEGKRVTSLTQELNRDISIDEALPHLLDAFRNRFDCDLIMKDDHQIDMRPLQN